MTTPSLPDAIDRLAHLLSATRGIARALDPDPVMSEHDCVNLYFLTMLLAEQLEKCLFDITHVHIGMIDSTSVPPAQDEEADDDN